MSEKTQFARYTAGTGLVLAVVLLLPLAMPASGHHLERRFTVEGRPVVTVQNTHGRVQVRSWKKAEVVVVGDHASDKVEVDTEQAGNRIEVKTHLLTENVTPAELKADYTITVPEESELRVRTDSGSVVIERVYGDLTFDTVAADVNLQEVAGYLVIKTISGPIVCLRCAGRLEVNSISGSVRLLEPALDNVRVQTSSGDIYYDGNFVPRGIYNLKNYSGLIEVRFSDTDSFDLIATSLYGTVENQAKITPDTHGQHPAPASRFAKSLIGTFNEGHAKVELSSFSGKIKILKRE